MKRRLGRPKDDRVELKIRLPKIAVAYLKKVARDPEVDGDISEAIFAMVQSLMIEDFEKVQTVDAETGRPVEMRSLSERDRGAADHVGVEKLLNMTGDDIRGAREKLGLTQGELAERLKVDPMTVSRWERGMTHIRPREAFRLQQLVARADVALGSRGQLGKPRRPR